MRSNSTFRSRALKRTVLAVAMGAVFTTGAVFAQSNASGTIFGRADAAPGGTVHLENLANGLQRDITVDADGRYRASSLPVGRYKVTLMKDGQVVETRDNVAVNIGTGSDVSFASASTTNAQNLEGVAVIASAMPAIDVSSVDSRTVLTSEQLQKIPVARNVTAATLLAPGAVGGDSRYGNVVSLGGSSAAENQTYVNGYAVTNALTGIGFTSLPFDAIDQQQVYTGGYGAEYGRSTGGVTSIITKRGGNEWKAGVAVFWAPRALADSPRSIYYKDGTLFQDRSRNKTWETQYDGYISGPLVKDKLFLYAAGEFTKDGGSRGVDPIINGTQTINTSHATRWLAKVDWNITDSNILELTGIGEDNQTTNRVYGYDYDSGQGERFGTERRKNYDGVAGAAPGGNVYIAKYTGYLTDSLTVNALYGRSNAQHVDTPTSATGRVCPIIVDARTEFAGNPATGCGIIGGSYLADGAKDRTNGWRLDVEYHAGDHDIRAGFDNQTLESTSGTVYEGGGYWRYVDAPPTGTIGGYPDLVVPPGAESIARFQNVIFKANVKTVQEAQFIEDHWQFTDRWLAYIGLRNEQFKNLNGAGETYVKQRHQLAPRLGVSWDVFGDSSLKVYANAGRYHLAIPSNVAIRGASASIFSNQYYSFTGIDPVTGVPTGAAPISSVYYQNGEDGTTPDPRQVAAKGLKAYYQDEYILGMDKQLGDSWAFGVKATYRKLRSSIDDFCDSRPFEAWGERNGVDLSNAKIDGCYLFNPGESAHFDLDTTGNGDYRDIFLTKEDLGFPKLKRHYYSLEAYLEHQFNNNWYGKLQYTYSRSYGNSEGMLKSDIGQTDPSVTQDWDFRELMIGSNGDLPNDRKHQLKAYGYWQMTPEWLFGANVAIASGRPKNCIGYAPGDLDPYRYGAAFFFCNGGEPTPRGSQGRLPWTYQLDLNAEWRPAFADHKLAFTADVFNVTGKQSETSIDETGEESLGSPAVSYGRPLSFQQPRYVRVGVKYDFSL